MRPTIGVAQWISRPPRRTERASAARVYSVVSARPYSARADLRAPNIPVSDREPREGFRGYPLSEPLSNPDFPTLEPTDEKARAE